MEYHGFLWCKKSEISLFTPRGHGDLGFPLNCCQWRMKNFEEIIDFSFPQIYFSSLNIYFSLRIIILARKAVLRKNK